MNDAQFRRPAMPGPALFEGLAGDGDPAERVEAGVRVAQILVRGVREAGDAAIAERVVQLADEQGLDTLAQWWSGAPDDSLAGSLWRLYALRTWVRDDPVRASREFAAGRAFAPVDEAIAGVVDPPGPREVVELVDAVLRGVATGDLSSTLQRAAAFARLVGVGRAHLEEAPDSTFSASRLVTTANTLERAARHERLGTLR